MGYFGLPILGPLGHVAEAVTYTYCAVARDSFVAGSASFDAHVAGAASSDEHLSGADASDEGC